MVRRTPAPALVPVSVDTLERIEAKLDTVLRLLEHRGRRYDMTDDLAWIRALACFAGRVFSVGELMAHARVDATLRTVIGDLTPRQVGKRLRTLAGASIGGFRVERIGRDERGSLWSMAAVSDH